MSYCTQEDLVDRFGTARLVQLTDRTNKPATTINPTMVAKHITDASSMIDGYIGKRVQLPLAIVPPMLTKVAVDLAWYYLLGDAAGEKDPATLAYRDAIRWLQDVAKGLIVIGDEGDGVAPAGGGEVKLSGPQRIFDRETLAGL